MSVLPGSFAFLHLTGLWIPSHWCSSKLRLLYKSYTILVLFLICWFTITELIELVCSHTNMEDFTSNIFMLLTMISNCGKYINVLIYRRSINQMLDILQEDPCLPRDEYEMSIQNKWDRIIWSNTMIYGVLVEVTVLLLTLGTFLRNIPVGTLPFDTWLPYNYSHGAIYWHAYIQQLVTQIIAANTALGYDTLVSGMIMQISAKLNILSHRFINLAESVRSNLDHFRDNPKVTKLEIERKLIADCVECHHTIFKLANIVNATFNTVIFLQYTLSTMIICASTYNITHIELLSSEFIGIILYLCCMLIQIYIYCDAGDECSVISSDVGDAIYNMNWTTLNTSSIKSLVIMMSRTLRPILFTSGSLVTLSLDSFMNVIKVSYSTYNVLQGVSH